jgi:membrane-associated protease RseP (regulator of RpoE activity)
MDVILWVLTYAPVFLLIISVVITVHELGHYWVGRMFGAAVESFAIGFGNPIVEKRDGRGTRWRLNWIPLGGFVKFVGEVQLAQDLKQELPQTAETEEEAARLAEVARAAPPKGAIEGRPTTFHDNQILVGRPYNLLNPWQRIAVSLGGPVANFLFAIAAFAVIGGVQGVPQAQEVFVRGVIAGEAAERAGFMTGDVVIEAGGRPVTTAQDIIMATQLSAGEAVSYRVLRGQETVALLATPVEQELVDSGMRMTQKVGRIGLDQQVEILQFALKKEAAQSQGQGSPQGVGELLQSRPIGGAATVQGKPDQQFGPACRAPEGQKAGAVLADQCFDREAKQARLQGRSLPLEFGPGHGRWVRGRGCHQAILAVSGQTALSDLQERTHGHRFQ